MPKGGLHLTEGVLGTVLGQLIIKHIKRQDFECINNLFTFFISLLIFVITLLGYHNDTFSLINRFGVYGTRLFSFMRTTKSLKNICTLCNELILAVQQNVNRYLVRTERSGSKCDHHLLKKWEPIIGELNYEGQS